MYPPRQMMRQQPQMGRQSPTGSMQPQQGGGGTMDRSGGSPFGAMGRAMGGFMGGMGRGMLGGGSSGGNKFSQFQKPQPPMGGGGIGPSMGMGQKPPMSGSLPMGSNDSGWKANQDYWNSPQGRDQAKLDIGSMFSGTGQPAPWQFSGGQQPQGSTPINQPPSIMQNKPGGYMGGFMERMRREQPPPPGYQMPPNDPNQATDQGGWNTNPWTQTPEGQQEFKRLMEQPQGQVGPSPDMMNNAMPWMRGGGQPTNHGYGY